MKNIFPLVHSLLSSSLPSLIVGFNLGEIRPIKNTANDFEQLTRIGDHIHEVYFGYNVMFIVDGEGKRSFGK